MRTLCELWVVKGALCEAEEDLAHMCLLNGCVTVVGGGLGLSEARAKPRRSSVRRTFLATSSFCISRCMHMR